MERFAGFVLALGVIGPGAMGAAAAQDAASPAEVQQPAADAGEPAAKDPARALQDIRAALQDLDGLTPGAVSVSIHAETIVLAGEVTDEETAARALAAAQQQSGGVRVSSHIEVSPQGEAQERMPAASSQLVREVESALRADRRTANLGISVSIDEKQVIGLHGLVPTRESRAAAEEIAARVSGVQKVSSRLIVPGE